MSIPNAIIWYASNAQASNGTKNIVSNVAIRQPFLSNQLAMLSKKGIGKIIKRRKMIKNKTL
jgi:hypothetical protein